MGAKASTSTRTNELAPVILADPKALGFDLCGCASLALAARPAIRAQRCRAAYKERERGVQKNRSLSIFRLTTPLLHRVGPRCAPHHQESPT
eukprot:tig00000430_g597.t1